MLIKESEYTFPNGEKAIIRSARVADAEGLADAPAKTPVQSMEPGSKNAKGTPNAAASMP